ncbi:MAG: sulfatase-like hydrolase/transferase [Gammaproteobacteria bacterium]|nr:sulfatase-like hydrolase/transferase [Gammaproteobacteria bacterium]MBT5715617.1 sulfatase-like hydrolase/transferase [Opitutae bacterium]
MTRLKILLLIICSVLISGVMGYKDYQQWDPLYFVIEMDSSANGTSQIFFNTGKGAREQDSSGLKVTHRGFQKYFFPVPASIESIRFDPINVASVLSIKNAGIENGVGDRLKIFPVQSFSAAKHINKMDVNEGVLTIHTEENANDPILVIGNSSFEDKSRWIDHLTQRGWIYLGYGLLIFGLFIFAIFMGLGRFWKQNEPHRKLFSLASTYLSCFLFVCLQVLFEVTKPINSGSFSLAAALELLVVVTAAFAIPALLLQSFALLPSHILNRLGKKKTAKLLVLIIPSTILFITLFIQLDETIYTFVGVKSLLVELFSTKLFIGFFSLAGFLFILRFLYESSGLSKPTNKAIMIMLFVNIVGAGFIVSYKSNNASAQVVGQIESDKVKKPHIVLFSADGINAENMSLYGYKRKTTPFLDSVQNEFFIATNFFSNSHMTHGSVLSMYNGRLPTKTLVVQSPANLEGSDQIKHMPYILKKLGYSTFSLTTPYFGSARVLKVLGGFDSINGVKEPLLYKHDVLSYSLGLVAEIDMARTLLEKPLDRISHLSGTKIYTDAFKFVTRAGDYGPSNWNKGLSDKVKVDFIRKNLTKDSDPTFIHIHLMAPHGPTFPELGPFGKGKTQDKKWMTDFYDDAILLVDAYFRELYEHLKNEGILNNTVLIYVSDHGKAHTAVKRIPLAIRFPDRSHTGRYQKNRQIVDLVPTLLKFLGTKAEYDLDGIDMVDDHSLPADRIIITANNDDSSSIVAIMCDKALSYNLKTRTWKPINAKIMPQSSCELPPTENINEKVTLDLYLNESLTRPQF